MYTLKGNCERLERQKKIPGVRATKEKTYRQAKDKMDVRSERWARKKRFEVDAMSEG